MSTARGRGRAAARSRAHAPAPSCRRGELLAAHLARYGQLPALRGEGSPLIADVEAARSARTRRRRLPDALKLRAVAAGRDAVVVANGAEGEPASHKDTLLMRINPHLVLDGARGRGSGRRAPRRIVSRRPHATRGTGEPRDGDRRARGSRRAPADRARRRRPTASSPARRPPSCSWLNGGPAKPAFAPPRPFERGVDGRPTLVQNVETLANIALIARTAPDWFRELGTPERAGLDARDARRRRRAPRHRRARDRHAACARRSSAATGSASVRGRCSSAATSAPGSPARARSTPRSRTPVCVRSAPRSARVPSWRCRTARAVWSRPLASPPTSPPRAPASAARACSACAAIAEATALLAAGDATASDALTRLRRLTPEISGRGACAHPNGATRLVESALSVFGDEVDRHLGGACSARSHQPLLPIPHVSGEWR